MPARAPALSRRHLLLAPPLLLVACGSLGREAPPNDACATPRGRARACEEEKADLALVEARTGEEYVDHGVRPFVPAAADALSTFSVDVDTGSYTVSRRKLREGTLPPPAAVRAEEFVNFFRPGVPAPVDAAFHVQAEAAASPFRPGKTLLRVALQARRSSLRERKPANLVFLVDTSGSMRSPDKLPLVIRSLSLLTETLRDDDRVAVCTYAGDVRVVLPPTWGSEREGILAALRGLEASGSTAMGSGIAQAYDLAARMAGPGRTSRVFVCSDGDANVGPTSHEEILRTIERQRARGVTLGTVGFGMGNYRDGLMEQLADRGDGSYAYVDSEAEARRLFQEDLVSSLELVARDAKVQVAFDPARVARYRLIGYENRAILDEQFRDDAVDAGEVGAGHAVTALYELELVPGSAGPMGEVRLRWREAEPLPEQAASELVTPLPAEPAATFAAAPARFRVQACAGELAEVLRRSPHVSTRPEELLPLLEAALDPRGDEREQELLELVRRAAILAGS